MATPKFFQNFPNVKYAVSADRAGNLDYITTKDFFRSLVIREDIYAKDTLYVQYTVQNGERPDQISYEQYGDEQYYWILLQINGITDPHNQWPLSDHELEEYIVSKYGSFSAAEQTRNYITVETKDAEGNIVLPGGLSVAEDFIFYYYATATDDVQLSSFPVAVTYADYEKGLNEAKKEIQILDKAYVYEYVREYKKYLKKLPNQQSEIGLREITNG